jgi:cystathionine beta-lyase/cystathionine gamma-synthase
MEPENGPYPHESEHHHRSRYIHGVGRSKRWDYDHHVVPPMTSSATFRLDSAKRGAQGFFEFANTTEDTLTDVPIYIYDRLDEPTRGMLEDNLAHAEAGDFALCFASGMAAISGALCTLLRSGEHIVAHKVLYGCTYSLFENWFPRLEIAVSLVDMTDHDSVRAAITEKTRVIYFETPVNPDMTIIDIGAMRALADEANAGRDEKNRVWVVVDNTFATPYCQQPLSLGAHVVCHSLTKGIGGFGTDIGGVVIGPAELHDPLIMYRKDFGASLSPKAAWTVLVYGLPTLPTRMWTYQKSARRIAEFLSDHPSVEEVRFPGLESHPQFELARTQMRDEGGMFAPGSMIYFVVRDKSGTGEKGARFIDHVAEHSYCMTMAVSLGQIKTLIECPYSMTHAAMPEDVKRRRGMVPGGMRLSVGLENPEDLISELKEALEAI